MDCVQEAYLELLIALQRGNEIKNYKAWLYKVTMNKRNQLLGETVQRKEVPIPDNISDADEVELTVHYNETEPVVTQEEIEKLSVEIIDNLSDNDRTLYLDIYVHRKKLKDIAMQREKGLYAIKKQHERLKKKLRKKITEKADKLY